MKKSFLFILLGSLAIILLTGIFCFPGLTEIKKTEAQIGSNLIDINSQTPYGEKGLFWDWGTWPMSYKLKQDGPKESLRHMLEMMNVSLTNPDDQYAVASRLIDFNGDGLNDYLYFVYDPAEDRVFGQGSRGYMALKNLGNGNFERVYKCFWRHQNSDNHPGEDVFYGDCADTSSSEQDIFHPSYFSEDYLHPLFFDDRLNWPSSGFWENTYYSQILNSLETINNPFALAGEEVFYERASQFSDINGDGLIDFLFYQRETDWQTDSHYISDQYLVFINRGDFTLEPAYKCETGDGIYGDCAGQ